jgi:hypothetical protein
MHIVRDMGKADDEQLAAIADGAAHLLDELGQFMGGQLVEALCIWREAAHKQLDRRAAAADPARMKRLRPQQAS